MTTTNVFQGLAEGRNSSRVLRPPGGGPTDVLGLNSTNEPQQNKKISPRNVSSITEGTNTVSPTEAQKPAPVNNEPPPPAQAEPAPVAAAPVTQTAPPAQAPQRARVPPGGFSSGGFW